MTYIIQAIISVIAQIWQSYFFQIFLFYHVTNNYLPELKEKRLFIKSRPLLNSSKM